MASNKIRVMLVDDHPFIRMGYRKILEPEKEVEVCSEASNGTEAYFFYYKHKPDVVLMDISLPDVSGIEITRKIIKRDANAKVLMASMHRETTYVEHAMQVGALGYITKVSTADTLPGAIKQVARGKFYLDSDLAQVLAEQKLRGEDDPFSKLSPREFEIFRLMLAGHHVQDIAEVLNVSKKTVSNICSSIRTKLGVSSNIQLFQLAMRHGIIES